MKKSVFLVAAALFISHLASAQLYFYGDQGALPLEADPSSQVIHFENNNSFHAFLERVPFNWRVVKQIEKYNMVVIEGPDAIPENLETQADFSDLNFLSQDPVLRLDDGFGVWLGYEMLFEPKVGFESEVAMLIRNTNGKLHVNAYGMYSAELENPMLTLSLANELVESGYANWAHPNFYANHKKHIDPRYNRQFQMHNTGQSIGGVSGVNDIDCDAPEAWAISTGSSDIVVAIIDDGVEDHEDMEDSSGNSRILPGNTPANNGDGTPVGSNSHGMACTGIVAASHNNVGVRGLAPNVKILPIDIFQGSETTADLAEAFYWAKDQGADVLSNSWGYGSCTFSLSALNTAINDARSNGRGGLGCVVVFASGNEYQNCVAYPADLPYVMGVGAVTSLGAISTYSNEGPTLDIVAPSNAAPGQTGAGVSTTDRPGSAGYSSGNYTNSFGGTSAACPLVSGAAALVLSVNEGLAEDEVRSILEMSATDMGSSGFDNTFGNGRLNAHQALILAVPDEACESSINVFPYTESFESGLNWTQENSDELDWTLNSGGTVSNNTGPSSALDGDTYLYIEASYPNYPNKSAKLKSPCFDLSVMSNPELSFAYHMYGVSMGELKVEISTDNGINWDELMSISGNQGDLWNTLALNLSSYSAATAAVIRFTGTTSTSYTGDISIDALSIDEANTSNCDAVVSVFPYQQGFESASSLWNQANDDNINWTRKSGSTPSSQTGPTGANEGIYYMYIEASSPNYPSKTANLDSDCFDLSDLSEASVSFDYHMFGSAMGSLSLQIRNGNDAWTTLWSLSGDQGNSWKTATVDLSTFVGNAELVLRFNGSTGASYRSDIAIDNLVITSSGSSGGNTCPGIDLSGYSVDSYGGSQDTGNANVSADGSQVDIDNNAWKSINYPYEVTANTVISFEFKSTAQGEIHGIGFDTDPNISSQYTFKVYGSQNWGILNDDSYVGSDWVSFSIPVGDYYTGSFSKLFFVGDNDNGPAGDNSSFRNISVFESGDCDPSLSSYANESTGARFGTESEQVNEAHIYPNPTRGELYVQTSDIDNGKIEILDLTGKVLLTEQIVSPSQSVSLDNLSNGLYLVKVFDNSQVIETFSLVKTE